MKNDRRNRTPTNDHRDGGQIAITESLHQIVNHGSYQGS